MQPVRHLLAQRRFAALILAATLLLKLLVPTGYMLVSEHGRIAVMLCSGTGPATIDHPVHGSVHKAAQGSTVHGAMAGHGQSKDHGKAEMPCAFSGLSAAMTGAVDPVQLAALIAFVMAIGLIASALPPPARPAYLRPPLRGPPAYL